MSLPDEPTRSPGRLLIAGALIVVGMIIFVPSGVFTFSILHYFFENLIQSPNTVWHNVSTVEPFEIEVFAGLVAGASLIWAGIRIGRRK